MKIPLAGQVVLAASLGILLGLLFGQQPFVAGFGNQQLGHLGMLVIRLLKALAPPLVLVAIIDAFVRTEIRAKQGFRLVLICLFNVTVASILGLILMNALRPGDSWRGHLTETIAKLPINIAKKPPAEISLDPIKNLSAYIPESMVEPFLTNNLISIVLAGVLGGAALRAVRNRYPDEPGVQTLANIVGALFHVFVQILEWVVKLVPLAVLGTTADAVGHSGIQIFKLLAPFLGIILLGLAIHTLLYYPVVAYLVGKKSPAVFYKGCFEAVVTGVSCNSSLATVPVTLRCLTEKLGVSQASARLAACVGTNLNNDGITLYEAMAALFIAQALGPPDLSIYQQVGVVFASVLAGVGVAGVPEAGLIVLPLVLGASGLSEGMVAAAVPLILPVDWIIARVRSGVNVTSDIVVAVMLDGLEPPESPVFSESSVE
jgi:Na+/H+-dicarboxylate symporter